jgi:hypothetical protein
MLTDELRIVSTSIATAVIRLSIPVTLKKLDDDIIILVTLLPK